MLPNLVVLNVFPEMAEHLGITVGPSNVVGGINGSK